MSWETPCRPKEEGGVGIHREAEMNEAFLARLGWRLLNEKGSQWSRTLVSKYGRGRDGFSILEHKLGFSHVWKGLVNISKVLKGTKWRINNGRNVNFQEYPWVEDVPLSSLV